uniref:Uncharacterized protein n=1 Tax=Vibrio genomosp. F6 TaxID=723172 RepID=A0A0H3ZRU1_9VIBR|nr:hypothetical protein [Vibrio genomosp. F6]
MTRIKQHSPILLLRTPHRHFRKMPSLLCIFDSKEIEGVSDAQC